VERKHRHFFGDWAQAGNRKSLLSILSLYWSWGVNVMFAWCWSWTLWQCSWRVVSEWSRCKHFDSPFSDACFSSNRCIHDSNANLASLFHYCSNQNTFSISKDCSKLFINRGALRVAHQTFFTLSTFVVSLWYSS
jgi:hypothetical protein